MQMNEPDEETLKELEKYGKKFLFYIDGDIPVFRDDILYHPNVKKYGWFLKAEFKSTDGLTVTMRAYNGAVPTVKISDLMVGPPEITWCKSCGQRLPPK